VFAVKTRQQGMAEIAMRNAKRIELLREQDSFATKGRQ
jgi:hypothetical protein